LLREHQYVVALDTKANPPLAWPGYTTFYRFDDVRRAESEGRLPNRIIFEPDLAAVRTLQGRTERDREQSEVAECFRWVYGRGSTALYVDEVFDCTTGAWWLPEGYDQCLTRGRSRFITVLSSTQTPMRVPSKVMSQAEQSYVFFLKMRGEREKVADMTGIDADAIWNLPKTYFIYSEQGERRSRTLRLNLKSRG